AHHTSAEARQYRHAPSPLQKTIDLLLRILTAAAVVLCLLYVGLWFVRSFSQADLVEMVAATVTSMVPQGLVLMTTLAFTLAGVRLGRGGALGRRLGAVGSRAAVAVLCMDKTGTLTPNRLRLDRLRPLDDGVPEEEVRRRLSTFAWASIDARNKTIQALRDA